MRTAVLLIYIYIYIICNFSHNKKKSYNPDFISYFMYRNNFCFISSLFNELPYFNNVQKFLYLFGSIREHSFISILMSFVRFYIFCYYRQHGIITWFLSLLDLSFVLSLRQFFVHLWLFVLPHCIMNICYSQTVKSDNSLNDRAHDVRLGLVRLG